MEVKIPELAPVILVGPSGSGKSTLARTLFKPTEVISSDFCRGLVADDENDQSATAEAFDLLHYIVGKRRKRGSLPAGGRPSAGRARAGARRAAGRDRPRRAGARLRRP